MVGTVWTVHTGVHTALVYTCCQEDEIHLREPANTLVQDQNIVDILC